MANAANITRRSIFKLAPAAVLATGGAIVAFPANSEPLTLDQEIEASIAHLRELVAQKYPKADTFNHDSVPLRTGGVIFCLTALAPSIPWSGAGYYEIWLSINSKEPSLMWVDECWSPMDQAYGYRAYVRENGQQVSASEYFTDKSLSIHRKL